MSYIFKDENKILSIRKAISKLEPLKPAYSYPSEVALNPAYTTMSSRTPLLDVGDHRIFVLRGDDIVATGIKQSTITKPSWEKIIDADCCEWVSTKDRFGHPSLTWSEDKQVGAKIAGHLVQRKGRLELYMHSGRFQPHAYFCIDQIAIEVETARQLRIGYGGQPIVFYYAEGSYDSLRDWLTHGGDAAHTYWAYEAYQPEDLSYTYADEVEKVKKEQEAYIHVAVMALQRVLDLFLLERPSEATVIEIYKIQKAIKEKNPSNINTRYWLNQLLEAAENLPDLNDKTARELGVIRDRTQSMLCEPTEEESEAAQLVAIQRQREAISKLLLRTSIATKNATKRSALRALWLEVEATQFDFTTPAEEQFSHLMDIAKATAKILSKRTGLFSSTQWGRERENLEAIYSALGEHPNALTMEEAGLAATVCLFLKLGSTTGRDENPDATLAS